MIDVSIYSPPRRTNDTDHLLFFVDISRAIIGVRAWELALIDLHEIWVEDLYDL